MNHHQKENARPVVAATGSGSKPELSSSLNSMKYCTADPGIWQLRGFDGPIPLSVCVTLLHSKLLYQKAMQELALAGVRKKVPREP